MSKVLPVKEAIGLIQDGDYVATVSVGPTCYPEYLVRELEQRFLETNHPQKLTLYAAGGHGNPREHICDQHFAHAGLLKRYTCTHPKVVPEIRDLIEKNEVEGYVIPQGVLNQMYRCAAAKQAGLLSKIGMGTYVDPRQEGGKLNSISTEDLVRLMEIDGEEWLFYKCQPVTVALLRGTYADENGNITIDHEALKLEIMEAAMAAKASRGKVIVQVKAVVQNGSLNARQVVIPGEMVDAVVVCEEPEKYHRMLGDTFYNPFLNGDQRCPVAQTVEVKQELTSKDIICRRAVYELFPGAVVNIGVGLGGGVGMIASLEGIQEKISFALELGVFGGVPLPVPNFGVSLNPSSFVSPPTMFDFYHGGGLDVAILGAAEIDKEGNVNASRFSGHRNGQGGFIDISQTGRKVVFVSHFRAKDFDMAVEDGKVVIRHEGLIPKFVENVEQITFSGKVSRMFGQEVIYVTERAVFRLTDDGLVLTEIAPGLDLQKDVLDQMGFEVAVSPDLKLMDERIFRPGRMGCFD